MSDRGAYIMTYPGKIKYYPFDPKPEEVSIIDIAHHLSHICRYNGACSRHYSVAEHSLLVSLIVDVPYKLDALIHDAGEAYTGDVVRPIKHSVAEVRQLATRNQRNVENALGLSVADSVVEAADGVVLGAELIVLKDADQEAYQGDRGEDAVKMALKSPWLDTLKSRLLVPSTPSKIERLFSREYARLNAERRAAKHAPPMVWR